MEPPPSNFNSSRDYARWRVRSRWKNFDLIHDIKREIGKRTVAFRRVKGHSGDPLNELADRLATTARHAA